MPLSDASSRGSREAEKVQAWYAEAKQRTAGGEDASKLLMASLAADIQREIQQASSRLKRGSDASSRLYQDAQRRAHKAASATASELSAVSLVQHASALSFEERSAVQARNTELLAEMESRKQSEARSLNIKVGVREVPTLFTVGKPAAALPEKTYQELLYEEGMLGKEERQKWREESVHLLSACEQQQCTFHPSLNARSVDLTRGRPKLFNSTTEVLDAHRARRAALEDQLRRKEEATLSAPNAGSPGPRRSSPVGRGEGGTGIGGKPAAGGKVPPGRPASADGRRTVDEVVEHLCSRGEEMRERKLLAKAEIESKYRQEETFSPFINRARRSGTGAAVPSPPAHERLFARAPASPPHSARLSAGGQGSPAAVPNSPALHTQGKHRSPLSAQQQQRSDQLYAVAAAHRARHDARTRAATGAARQAAASPNVDSRSRRLAFAKATRELQALYNAVAPPCGDGLSLSELHALLSSLGLVRPPSTHTVYPKAEPATQACGRRLQLDPHPEIEPELQPEIESELRPDVDCGPDPEIDPEPRPEIDPEPSPEIDPEPCPEIDPEQRPEIDPEPRPVIEPEPRPERDPEPRPEIDTEPRSGAEVELESTSGPSAEAGAMPAGSPEAEANGETCGPSGADPPALLPPPTRSPPPMAWPAAATPPAGGGAAGGASSPASGAVLAEDAALVAQLHRALADQTETVPFERVAALLLGSAPAAPPGPPLGIPADQASKLRLAAKSVRRSRPAHPSTEEAQLADFSFRPTTAESAASFAELYSVTDGSFDGSDDAALTGSPVGSRGESRAGETVFEQLYTRAAQMRSHKERLRAEARQRDMNECTFRPDVSKTELSELEAEHKLRASRWEWVHRLGASSSR